MPLERDPLRRKSLGQPLHQVDRPVLPACAADIRKKILLGAFLMDRMNKNAEYAEKVMPGLSEFLQRDDDRALFGLAPMPSAETA